MTDYIEIIKLVVAALTGVVIPKIIEYVLGKKKNKADLVIEYETILSKAVNDTRQMREDYEKETAELRERIRSLEDTLEDSRRK